MAKPIEILAIEQKRLRLGAVFVVEADWSRAEASVTRHDGTGCIDVTGGMFDRYGSWVVVGGRFLSVVRTYAAFGAGATDMGWRRFLTLNTLGGIGWATLIGFGSAALGAQAGTTVTYALVALAAVGAAGLALVGPDTQEAHRHPRRPNRCVAALPGSRWDTDRTAVPCRRRPRRSPHPLDRPVMTAPAGAAPRTNRPRYVPPRPVRNGVPASRQVPGRRLVGRRILTSALAAHRWWLEVLIAVGFYVSYEASRGLAAGRAATAMAHGRAVDHLERLTHLAVEPALAAALNGQRLLAAAAGYYYSTAHFLITIAVLVWLYARHRTAYPRLRTSLLLINLAALAVFWALPVAPPRLAVPNAVDTLTRPDVMGAGHPHSLFDLANPYAAMPSLHVAWAVWCALAVGTTSTRPLVRRLAWLYPLTTAVVVMGTGNHYLLDVAAGLVLALAAQQAARIADLPGWSEGLSHQAVPSVQERRPYRVVRPSADLARPAGAGPVSRDDARRASGPARLAAVLGVVRLLIGISAGAGLIALVVWQRGTLVTSWQVLTHLDWRWLPLIVVAELISMESVAQTHWRLLRGAGAALRPRSVRAVVYASTAISVSLPLAGSQVGAGYSLRELVRRGADAAAAAWVLVLSGIGATTAFALLVAAGTAATGSPRAAVVAFGGGLLAAVPAVLLLWVPRRPAVNRRLQQVAAGLLARYRRVTRRPAVPAWQTALTVQEFAARLLSHRLTARRGSVVLALAVGNWLADCLCLTAAIAAVGAPIPWQGLLLAYVGAAGVNSLGLTPGGLGVVEAALTAGLVAAGLDGAHALAATLVYRLVSFWLVMVSGWVVFGFATRSAKRVNHVRAGPRPAAC